MNIGPQLSLAEKVAVVEAVCQEYDRGNYPLVKVLELTRVSETTFYRYLHTIPEAKERYELSKERWKKKRLGYVFLPAQDEIPGEGNTKLRLKIEP